MFILMKSPMKMKSPMWVFTTENLCRKSKFVFIADGNIEFSDSEEYNFLVQWN